MLVIPGQRGKANCEGTVSRRELLRIGGTGMLGFTLADVLARESQAKGSNAGGPRFGKAKSGILGYLPGGPTHPALPDPNDNVPANVKRRVQPIDPTPPAAECTTVLPNLAHSND